MHSATSVATMAKTTCTASTTSGRLSGNCMAKIKQPIEIACEMAPLGGAVNLVVLETTGR